MTVRMVFMAKLDGQACAMPLGMIANQLADIFNILTTEHSTLYNL